MRACQRPSRRLRTSSLRRQSTGALLPMYAATLIRGSEHAFSPEPTALVLAQKPVLLDLNGTLENRNAGVFMRYMRTE
jgi:hypothetical protein